VQIKNSGRLDASRIVRAPGAVTTTPPISSSNPVPVNSVSPAITGTAQVGQTLTVSNGTWSNTPTSYAYQWKRAGTNISGATAQTYVPVSADVGNALTCAVVASNAGGAGAAATSAATSAVIASGPANFSTTYPNQPDSTTSTNQAGTVSAGSAGPIGILGGKAYIPPASNGLHDVFETYDCGRSDGTFVANVTKGAATSDGIIFRYKDADNRMMAYNDAGAFKVDAVVAGTRSNLMIAFNAVPANTAFKVEVDASGSTLNFKQDDTAIGNPVTLDAATMAAVGTATRIGPYWNYATDGQYAASVTSAP
jgi:hypothetical protein